MAAAMAADPPDPKDPDRIDPTRVPRPLRSALRADREATIARLQDAVAADHLELDELEERLDLAMQARTAAELKVLVQDLPETAPSPVTMRVVERSQMVVATATRAAPVPAVVGAGRAPVPAVVPETVPAYLEPAPIRLTSIFSGHQLEGRRVMPRETYVRCIFGGAELDLREATFMPGVTTVVCKATFGGINIIVPPHVRVECLGVGIFGGFHADNRAAEDAPDTDDMPVLRVVGRAVFGGVHAERKRLKRARGEQKRLARKE